MKKTISMMLAVVLCMGLFVGCEKSNDGIENNKVPKEVAEIVEAVNKNVMESAKTKKENFALTESFTLEGKEYFVYESDGVYKENGKEYHTTMKFECENGKFKLLEANQDEAFGLNIHSVAYVMTVEKEGQYIETKSSPTYFEYIKNEQ